MNHLTGNAQAMTDKLKDTSIAFQSDDFIEDIEEMTAIEVIIQNKFLF